MSQGPAWPGLIDPVGEGASHDFGGSVASAGDVNGDGYPDLIVGAVDAGPSFEGRAYIFHGGPSADDIADLILTGEATGAHIRAEEELGRKVYFLDYRAAAHLIAMDRFAPRFDCLLAGNFGADGLRDVIEEISGNSDSTALFSPGSHPLEPATLVEFVETEMKRVGEVAGFGVYRFE